MALSVGDKIGHYEVISLLGQGGMGEVYRARDTKLKRDVALKVLPDIFAKDPDRMARFQREAELLASLNHPNIAHIYGVEERALAMELVEGETLAGPLPVETALNYAKQIAEALEYAHEAGVIHRDLKPANVKITPEGVVKILDFGLAKAIEGPGSVADDPSISPTLTLGATRAGVILGTAAYMSPEQAHGRAADRRADIFSFGSVLYEMLTGARAFTGESVGDTLASVLKLEPDWGKLPSNTPGRIRNLLRRCLTKDRKQRLQAIGEARIVLDSPAVEEPEMSSGNRQGRQLAWIWPGIAAICLLMAAALAFLHFRETPPPEHTLRYTIAPPDGTQIVHSFAVSPDGRSVVMAAGGNTKRQLWLRSLDALQWQLLPTTEDGMYPFWSPDSRNIGFFANGQLRRIAAGGGPSQPLCDARNGRGGTWSRDDVILFSPDFTDGVIRRVPAAGGIPTDVTKAQAPAVYPAFLPDGRHFLYVIAGSSSGKSGVWVSSLDGVENRVLGDNSGFAFSPPSPGSRIGYVLFIRENILMAQPLDASSAQRTGEVFPVAEGVFLSQNIFAPVSVSDNGVLLYWTGGNGGGGTFQLIWYDRAGKALELVGQQANVLMPAISPDEKTIAFSRGETGGNRDIWLRDLVRGNDRRMTTDASSNALPFWSPKTGDRIVFRSNRGGHLGDLYLRASNGSGQDELLLSSPTSKIVNQWSRDGRFIVYTDVDPKTKSDLWVLPMGQDGKPSGKAIQFLHSTFNEFQGQLSPDSRWMAYTSDVSGNREVYVQPFPSADNELRISLAGGEQPRWSADGRELFYLGADGKITAVTVTVSSGPKPSLHADTPVRLFDAHSATQNDQPFFNYDVTADGKRFLVSTTGAAASSSGPATPPITVRVNWNPSSKN